MNLNDEHDIVAAATNFKRFLHFNALRSFAFPENEMKKN